MKTAWTIAEAEAGQRLDAWLARRPEVGARARASAWIERGKVSINGRTLALADAGARLKTGDRIQLWIDRPGSAHLGRRGVGRARSALRVVFEDAALIVADKPVGLLVEPLPGEAEGEVTMLDLVGDHLRSAVRARPRVVHRIDRDTSGLVLFAKTLDAQAKLKRQFERRTVTRRYLAVLSGEVRPREGVWEDRLTWDKARRLQLRSHPDDPRGKASVARYRVLEQFPAAALVEVDLVTGKRNQIRVLAALRGHPLVGERIYRPRGSTEEMPPFPRQALHACRLAFTHPATGEPVDVEAPVPDDMRQLLARLRLNAPRTGTSS